MIYKNKQSGFTIVELLIVIVVIGILAALVLNTFSGAQDKARQAKIDSDLSMIMKAIEGARIQNGTNMIGITQAGSTEGGCLNKPNGTDLATLPMTDSCWTAYFSAMDKLSEKSGVKNMRDIRDPWGRPYYINANEGENQTTHLCMNDYIGVYSQPFATNVTKERRSVPLWSTVCP
jgi:prepilin-type N-terminal cleavage/methylation domain-containing protein